MPRLLLSLVLAFLLFPYAAFAADTCPVAAQPLGATLVRIVESTAGKVNDFCSNGWGAHGDPCPGALPDVVYAFDLPQTSGVWSVSVDALSSGFDPAIYLSPTCGVDDGLVDDRTGSVEDFKLAWPSGFGGVWYVVVDGRAGAGAFELTATFTADACGDGVVSGAEQCDFSQPSPWDGCGDPGQPGACSFEPPGPGDTCASAQAITLAPSATPLVVRGTTAGYTDTTIGGGLGCSGLAAGAPDHVYAVTPTSSGTLTAKVGYETDGASPSCSVSGSIAGCWDQVLYASTTCGGTPVACSDKGWNAVESFTRSVTAGVPVYITVDGHYPDSCGPYHLALRLQ